MLSKLFFSAGNSLFELSKNGTDWYIKEKKGSHEFRCLAADPTYEGRLYAGTFDNGLWISDDHGETWRPAGEGIKHSRVLSVAVSPTETKNGYRVVWAGTEPSGLFRSEDGGKTWSECPNLLNLPSRSTWSFPPRPYTHHVRWIQPDIHDENRIFVGIELGGVMKSEDKGKTWEDRKRGSQYDCHTLTMTPLAKDRIYEAAGGGFAESSDGGKTWQTINDGLDPFTYLVSVAVDPANPDIMVASAAERARTAYVPERANTVIVRREARRSWKVIREGLPESDGSSAFLFTTHHREPGVFYAVNNLGVFQSSDAGKSWGKVPVKWPEHLKRKRVYNLIAL